MGKVFVKGTRAYDNLMAVAKLLEADSANGYRYEVENCWKDLGAGIGWTTIVCYDDNETGVLHSWQILNTREWELAIRARSIDDIANVAKEVKNGRYFQD